MRAPPSDGARGSVLTTTKQTPSRKRPRRGRPEIPSQKRRGRGPTQARLIAVRVLDRVERSRAFADLALHHALSHSGLAGPDRALATELVYGTLRWRGRLDFALSHVLDRKLDELEPLVASTLRAGAYQLLFADRIPASAAVDESVRCIRAGGMERATGLVNAVLRRLARERERIQPPALEDDAIGHLVHALSLPEWIARRWLERFGPEEACELARASNHAPPHTVRVNPLAEGCDQLLEELRENFSEATPCRWAPNGLLLGRKGAPTRDPAFLAGRYTVQDEASQLVVELLAPVPGERVLDTCAAPGTKTTAIAERLAGDGHVLALDRHARRLRLVLRDARRLGLGGIAIADRDATEPLADLAADAPFDRVLVDAPCSGLGTLRRNPDARWRVIEADVESLAQTQRAILANAARTLRPGGTLVYSTCTLLAEENEDVVNAFLEQHSDFRLVERARLPRAVHEFLGEDGFVRCLPHRHDTDGFFAARLERTE